MGEIVVGISEFAVAKAPEILVTYSLGSCVGICIYDPLHKLGGLSHILLPTARGADQIQRVGQFADLAIPKMVQKMKTEGANPYRMVAKIVGGAQMFEAITTGITGHIGERNLEEVRRVLKELSIPIIEEDVGGNFSRTLYFNLEDGEIKIKATANGRWIDRAEGQKNKPLF